MTRRILAAVVAACALSLTGCSMLPEAPGALPTNFVPEPTVSPGDGPGALSPDGFSAAQRMTVRVRNVGCGFLSTGTGFALDAHTLVTNRHVVENSEKLQVQTYDGRFVSATTVATTTVADIAIVTTEESLGGTFAQVARQDPKQGDVITIVGYPKGGRLSTVSGVVLGATPDPLGSAVGTVLATTAVVEPGSSGSPVLDEYGNVVGVVYATTDTSQSLIVPVSTLAALLEQTSLLVPTPAQC